MSRERALRSRGELLTIYGNGDVQVFTGNNGESIRTEISVTGGRVVVLCVIDFGVTEPRTLVVSDREGKELASARFGVNPNSRGSFNVDRILVDRDGKYLGCQFAGNDIHLAIAKEFCSKTTFEDIGFLNSSAFGVAEWVRGKLG
jgi:hypothetical protein